VPADPIETVALGDALPSPHTPLRLEIAPV